MSHELLPGMTGGAVTIRWLVVVMLSLCLEATAETLPLVVETFPPRAQVFEGSKYLGLAGERLQLSPGNHALTLRLEHHKDKPVTLGMRELQAGRYPERGVVSLEPRSFFQHLRNWLVYRWQSVVALALGLGGVGFFGLRHVKTWRRQQATLGRLVDQADAASHSLVLHQVGGYRIISHLGQGGMAEVYKAVPKDTLDAEAAVAIKVMNRDMREQAEFVQRFLREIVVSQDLVHPGVVEVLEWGWHGERLYLVMELVDGVQLRKALPELTQDRQRAVNLLTQLMDAVSYAHQRGVSHRDLKPENVMLTSAGRIKIMDFGLARAVDSQTLTQVGSAMGTPKYMAPEMVATGTGDDRADQYALGVMIFEVLTGRLPFESDEILYLLYCHANQPPPAPSSLNEELSPAVDEVVLKMLNKQPRERYRDVESAKVALLKALEI